MRLEGWHVFLFLAMLVVAVVVIVAVTLIVVWTVRRANRGNSREDPGSSHP